MKKGFAQILIIILIGIIIAIGTYGYYQYTLYRNSHRPIDNMNISVPDLKKLTNQTPNTDQTASWKTYKSKDNLYQISYPSNWTVNDVNGVDMGDHAIDVSIIEWNDGSKKYAEEQWQSTPCGGSGGGNSELGCVPMEIKESKKINLNGHLVYRRVDGNGQIHAWIPNKDKNKTIEIYSVLLKDKDLFDQILSTFKFL